MWKTGRYMVHVFQEKGDWYVYDVNSNEVYGAREIGARALQSTARDRDSLVSELSGDYTPEEVDSALAEIDEAKEQQGIFKEWSIEWRGRCPICSDPEKYENKMEQLVIETTTDCNLRCVYCPFTYQEGENIRQHNNEHVITKAVNYFIDHSEESRLRAISLYGGEPFLNLDAIRTVSRIVEERGLKEKIRIVIDTNATLLTDENIEFVAEYGANLQVSLDGPEYIHDENRVFAGGKGTHRAVINNVNKLAERLPDFRHKVSFAVTIAPPFMISEVDSYFRSLFKNLGVEGYLTMSVNFAEINHVNELYTEKYGDYKAIYRDEYRRATEHYISMCEKGRHDDLGPIYRSLFDKRLHAIYIRSSAPIPREMGMNACCAPGVRKLYVTANGKYMPCERMSYDYFIGDVGTGISHGMIDDLYKDFGEAIRERCLSCWAIRLCNLCFTSLYEKSDGKGLYVPEALCEYTRNSKEEELKFFLGLHQASPGSLDFLKDVHFG